jgi:hypothetical protein
MRPFRENNGRKAELGDPANAGAKLVNKKYLVGAILNIIQTDCEKSIVI